MIELAWEPAGERRSVIVFVAQRKLALTSPNIIPKQMPAANRRQYLARYGLPKESTALILFTRRKSSSSSHLMVRESAVPNKEKYK